MVLTWSSHVRNFSANLTNLKSKLQALKVTLTKINPERPHLSTLQIVLITAGGTIAFIFLVVGIAVVIYCFRRHMLTPHEAQDVPLPVPSKSPDHGVHDEPCPSDTLIVPA